MEYYFSFSILCIVVALFIKDARDDKNIFSLKDRINKLENDIEYLKNKISIYDQFWVGPSDYKDKTHES